MYTSQICRLPSVLSKLEEYNAAQAEYIHYLMEKKCELMRTKEYLSRVQTALEIKHDFFYQTLASLVIQSFLKGLDEQVNIKLLDKLIHRN